MVGLDKVTSDKSLRLETLPGPDKVSILSQLSGPTHKHQSPASKLVLGTTAVPFPGVIHTKYAPVNVDVPAGIALLTVKPAAVPKAVNVTIVPLLALNVPQNLRFSSANLPKPTEKKLLPLNILNCPVDSCSQNTPVGRLLMSGDASCIIQ